MSRPRPYSCRRSQYERRNLSCAGSRTWSFTQIDQYVRCPLKYRFTYVDRLEPEFVPAALAFGSGIHGAAAFLFRGRADGAPPSLADVQAVCEGYWRMGPGARMGREGAGSGPMMQMQGMMQQMQGMMAQMAEMMKGGPMSPEQQKRMGELMEQMSGMMGGMHGMMGGARPGPRSPGMMGQMSEMMQHMAEMQKHMGEMMGAPGSQAPEKK